jgi:hypothetical protein
MDRPNQAEHGREKLGLERRLEAETPLFVEKHA